MNHGLISASVRRRGNAGFYIALIIAAIVAIIGISDCERERINSRPSVSAGR
jgi:hypothetical protein